MSACIFNMLDTSLGTLWWVREKVWAEKIANYSSNRKFHPGLSVNEAKAHESREYVPLLHGTSRRHGNCVVVLSLTRDEPEHPTYFGQIRPAKIEASLFTSGATTLWHDEPGWTRRAAVVKNHHKPWVTEGEEEDLLQWLTAKRERQPWWKHRNP